MFANLLGQRIDGLILMGSYMDQSEQATKTLMLLRKRRLAIVEINDRLSRDHFVETVIADYHAATRKVMVRTNHNSQNDPMVAIDRKFGYLQTPGWYRMEKSIG